VLGLASLTNEEAFLINVNFGGSAQSIDLTLNIAAVTGTSGLAVTFTDYDRLAASGTVDAEVAGTDPATGTISLTLTTPAYDGVHQFKVSVRPATPTGISPFAGTVSAALPAGSITLGGHVSAGTDTEPIQMLFDREVRYAALTPTAFTPIVREFEVDFGATAHAETFFAEGGSLGPGQVMVAELIPGGGENAFPALSGTVAWLNNANYTTTSRSGKVRFRVTLTPGMALPSGWRCVFGPDSSIKGTPPMLPPPGTDTGGDKDSPGCTAGAGIAPLPLLALAARRRRRA
jgi:hypothetical protein